MTKRILITSGPVHGLLDDNKLVSNRTRGIWASRFARWLASRDHYVTLLVADIHEKATYEHWVRDGVPGRDRGRIITHKGFWDYQKQCLELAKTHDAAVLASAVTNWIPAKPYNGKMPTTGYKPGDELNVPFILAPRVIDGMRRENSRLTLIGCKMTIGATRDEMIEYAYKTLRDAKCHAVIANDMRAIVDKTPNARPGDLSIQQLTGLRAKTVLYPDRAQFNFDIGYEEGQNFYKHLEAVICDEHFTTAPCGPCWTTELDEYTRARALFDRIVDKYRLRFVHKVPINGREFNDSVFGAIAVRVGHGGALCSPRKKNILFSSKDAVEVAPIAPEDLRNRTVTTVNGHKASMNALLLVRHLDAHPSAAAVLHLHEQLPNVPMVPYAPPGTVRDNLREIVGQAYNIEGHGCVISLDERGEMYGRWEQ